MKQVSATVLALLLTAILILTSIPAAFAADTDLSDTGTAPTVYDVTDLGAVPNDNGSDDNAFTLAMNHGGNMNQPIIVHVPAGVYHIAGNIKIYSYTTLELDDDAVIISDTPEGSMVYGVHRDDSGNRCQGANCTHGCYTQISNVTITGGTWDRNDLQGVGNDSIISFHHAEHIVISNTVMKNCTAHYINVSGCRDVLIDHVTLRDAVEYTGTAKSFWDTHKVGDKSRFNTLEAIHTDFCNPIGENSDYGMPSDDTASAQVTVSNCSFINIFAGVGTHHPNTSRSPDIVVENNTAVNLRAYLCFGYEADNYIVRGNTITNGGAVGVFSNSSATVENNTFTGAKQVELNAVYALNGSTVTVKNNIITDAMLSGVSAIDDGTVIYASNNKITGPLAHGISVQNGAKLSASGNTISNSGGVGIYMKGSDTVGSGVSGNTIKNCATHAFYQYGGTAKFSGNTVATTQKTSVRILQNANLTANNNTITGAGEFAINATEGAVLSASGNSITGSGATKPAIKVIDGKAVLKNNKISSSAYHGIVVSASNGSTISGNTITNPAGYGIHIQTSTGVTADNNTVTGSKMNAMQVKGESSQKPATTIITNNKLSASTSSLYDLRLGKYAVNCGLGSNTLAHNRQSVDSTASYYTVIAQPVLKSAVSAYGGVTFSWNKSEGAAQYRVFRKTASTGWAKVADTTAVSITDKTAVDNTTYLYTVRCISKDGKKYTSTFDANGKQVTYHAAPVITKFENTATGTKMTFKGTAGAAKYRIFLKSGTSWKKLGDTTALTYTYNGLTGGTKYTYTVRAISAEGAYLSPYNTAGWGYAFIAAPAVPTLKNSKNGVVISWKKPSGAVNFRIFRKTGSGGWAKVADTANLTYTDKTAKNGTKYTYTIRCLSKDAKSYTSAYNTKGSTITCKR